MSCGYYYKTAKTEDGEAGFIVLDKSQEIKEELRSILGELYSRCHTSKYNVYYIYQEIEHTVDALNKREFSIIPKHDIYTSDNEIGLYRKARDVDNTNVSPSQSKFDQDTMIREITERGDEAYAFYKKWLSESESLDEKDKTSVKKVLDYFKRKRFSTFTKEEAEKIISDCKNHDYSFWNIYSSPEEFNKYKENAKYRKVKPTVRGALEYFIRQYNEGILKWIQKE